MQKKKKKVKHPSPSSQEHKVDLKSENKLIQHTVLIG